VGGAYGEGVSVMAEEFGEGWGNILLGGMWTYLANVGSRSQGAGKRLGRAGLLSGDAGGGLGDVFLFR